MLGHENASHHVKNNFQTPGTCHSQLWWQYDGSPASLRGILAKIGAFQLLGTLGPNGNDTAQMDWMTRAMIQSPCEPYSPNLDRERIPSPSSFTSSLWKPTPINLETIWRFPRGRGCVPMWLLVLFSLNMTWLGIPGENSYPWRKGFQKMWQISMSEDWP